MWFVYENVGRWADLSMKKWRSGTWRRESASGQWPRTRNPWLPLPSMLTEQGLCPGAPTALCKRLFGGKMIGACSSCGSRLNDDVVEFKDKISTWRTVGVLIVVWFICLMQRYVLYELRKNIIAVYILWNHVLFVTCAQSCGRLLWSNWPMFSRLWDSSTGACLKTIFAEGNPSVWVGLDGWLVGWVLRGEGCAIGFIALPKWGQFF